MDTVQGNLKDLKVCKYFKTKRTNFINDRENKDERQTTELSCTLDSKHVPAFNEFKFCLCFLP